MIGVFGANGFIGKHLIAKLAYKNCQCRAVSRTIDNDFRKLFEDKVDFIQADLNNALDISPTLINIDTVVQLVSSSSPGLMNQYLAEDIQTNVVPQVRFLQDCVRAGVRRFIFLSSGGTVYGPNAPTPTPESQCPQPISSYGLTKFAIEKYIEMHGHVDRLEYVVLRVANPYGPGQSSRKGQGLIPAVLGCWRANEVLKIYGDGNSLRDYIYIEDVIDAIVKSIEVPDSVYEIVNIGSGELLSVNQVVQKIEGALGVKILRNYTSDRETDVNVSSIDIKKSAQVLGWEPQLSFDQGLNLTIEEYINNQ